MFRTVRTLAAALIVALAVPLFAPAAGAAACPIGVIQEGAVKQQQYATARSKAQDAVSTWQSLVRATAREKNPARRAKLAAKWAGTRKWAQGVVDNQNAVYQINFTWHRNQFADPSYGAACRSAMHTDSKLGGLVPRP